MAEELILPDDKNIDDANLIMGFQGEEFADSIKKLVSAITLNAKAIDNEIDESTMKFKVNEGEWEFNIELILKRKTNG